MSRSESTAQVERDLALIEQALAAGAASAPDPADLELQRLALELRADSPAPDPAFAVALHERVAAGFPRARRGGPAALLRSPGRLLPAMGVAAALLVAVVVAVSLQSSSGEDVLTPSAGGGGEAVQSTPESGVAGDTLSAPLLERDGAASGAEPAPDIAPGAPRTSVPPVPPTGDFAPGRTQRIERSAALELQAPGDELERVADGVTAVTDRHDGFVLRSSFTSSDDQGAGGSFDLRIPVDQLNQAVRDLAGLATVRSRTQSGQDVTPAYVGARDRLRAARAERQSLLARLERAETDTQAEAIRARLDLVAREIDGLRGQLRQLRIRTSYAAVQVTLAGDDGDGGAATGSTGEALDDALGSLLGAVNVGLRILGVAIPLGVAALLVWLPLRVLRRRRRESALA